MSVRTRRIFSALSVFLLLAGLHTGCGKISVSKKGGAKKQEEKGAEYACYDNGAGNQEADTIIHRVDRCLHCFRWKKLDELYDFIHPDVGKQLTKDRFKAQYQDLVRAFGELKHVGVVEVHIIEIPHSSSSLGKEEGYSVEGESNYLPEPVVVSTPVAGRTAVVLCAAMGKEIEQQHWATMTLQYHEGEWWFLQCLFNPRILGGHNGLWFLEKARAFKKEGKLRNAYLYRFLGSQVLSPSPFLYSKTARDFLLRFQRESAPPNLPLAKVRPAETWNDGAGRTFTVISVAPSLSRLDLTLGITYASNLEDPLSPEAAAERRALFEYVRKVFPEYQEAFTCVKVMTQTRGGGKGEDVFRLDEKGK